MNSKSGASGESQWSRIPKKRACQAIIPSDPASQDGAFFREAGQSVLQGGRFHIEAKKSTGDWDQSARGGGEIRLCDTTWFLLLSPPGL